MKKFLSFSILGLLILLNACVALNKQEIEQKENQIDYEFEQIPIMPSASFSFENRSGKSNNVLVNQKFVTNATFEEIYTFYDTELQNLGWEFIEQKPMLIWGKDYGGKCVFYTKDDLNLMLDYVGNAPDYTIDYA